MARSYRKTPISGITKAESDKWFKRFFNKRNRAKVREMLSNEEYDKLQIFDPRYDWWSSPKDGKRWYGHIEEDELEKIIRK
jgi:hypothetical protein